MIFLSLPAHEIQTAICGNQGTCSHVSNEAIVFDLKIINYFTKEQENRCSLAYIP